MKLTKTLAVALEGIGCCVGVAGITIECLMHADIGYLLITVGATVVAVGSLAFAKLPRSKM